MKPKITVFLNDNTILRSSTEDDIEFLRKIKNKNKEFFFYNKTITKEEQMKWHSEFQQKKHDFLFIVESGENKIGCIGSRLFQGYCDIYNVILGDENYKGTGIMKKSLFAVVAINRLLYSEMHNRVRVLKSNPAIGWYSKIGFHKLEDLEDYILMQLKEEKSNEILHCKIEIEIPYNN